MIGAEPSPDRVGAVGEETATKSSRRRTVALVGSTVLLVVIAGIVYRTQIASVATHTVGPPEHTYPATLFSGDASPDLHLAAVGDVGYANDEVIETGAAMSGIASSGDPYDALVLLGDNAYPDGDPAVLDRTVSKPFGSVIDSGARLYAVLGNHDVLAGDGGLEQLEYLGMEDRWWSADLGDVLLVGLDSNQPGTAEQLQWLESTLSGSRERWKIVALHHGPFSSGYQGSASGVRDSFTPLFAQYGVQLVLSGHEHDYERTVAIDGVTYIVSGAGAEVRRTGTEEYTAYAAATFHFVDVNVFSDRIYVQAIDHDGRRFDDVVIDP
jgi:3',5'-cyclic AMP phosphodiesterase CpdA